ncbi:MAG: VOC family protein [Bryobacteraceae bacterium]|nr:VOC family protein [Bryobacteraceae bacterium]
MPRPIHFELHAEDPQRAIRFYETLFGWKFESWPGPMPYWIVSTGEGPGIDGGLLLRQGGPLTVNTISVDNIDDMIAKATAAGAEVAVPKMAVPTIGWLAYFKDTEGIIFGIMQMDPAAQ